VADIAAGEVKIRQDKKPAAMRAFSYADNTLRQWLARASLLADAHIHLAQVGPGPNDGPDPALTASR
jgi:hypothetical protein